MKQIENNKSSIILIVTLNSNKIESIEKVSIYQGEKMFVYHEQALQISKQAEIYLRLPESEFLAKMQLEVSKSLTLRNSKRDISWFLNRFHFRHYLGFWIEG